jgi:hypothetical protein
MSGTMVREDPSSDEIRRRAELWLTRNESREQLEKARAQAEAAHRELRKATEIDPKVLEQPMTV